MVEHSHNRRPDVVLFVNGLPLAVIELKNPGDENATLEGAFNQFQTYKDQIPSLFRTNAALVTSDGLHARLGTLTGAGHREVSCEVSVAARAGRAIERRNTVIQSAETVSAAEGNTKRPLS